jgi:hypothetical protein
VGVVTCALAGAVFAGLGGTVAWALGRDGIGQSSLHVTGFVAGVVLAVTGLVFLVGAVLALVRASGEGEVGPSRGSERPGAWFYVGPVLVLGGMGLVLAAILAAITGEAGAPPLGAGLVATAVGVAVASAARRRRGGRGAAAYEEELEDEVERQGLPTDPEAYRDGGLAVLVRAYSLQEAEVTASLLRGADIPAWVEGAAASSWFWHMQWGMHPGGVRVLVPTGRLADAQAFLEDRGQEVPGEKPGEPEEEDPAYRLYRSARGLALVLLIGLIAPVIFVLALRLLWKIRRARAQYGETTYLAKARRLAWFTVAVSFPIFALLAGGLSATIALGLLSPRLG